MYLCQTWTKEETDQLFDLCERFDLRFVVIADRFPTSRSVEELKNRYYSGKLVYIPPPYPTYMRKKTFVITSIIKRWLTDPS